MEIEVPEFFIVSNCPKCETRHAPVRDCPEVKMYLDAVYENQEIVFNGFPNDTVKFLLKEEEHVRQYYWVVRGETLSGYTCNDYLKWMRAT